MKNWVYIEPVDNKPFHFWKERDIIQPMDANEQILCIVMGDTAPLLNTGETINVTIDVNDVTCQKCLEWIHA